MIGNEYMSGKFKYVLYISVACLILGSWAMAGTYKISNLELTHQKEFTVLTIPGTVGMQVSHQSVVAKDGKPNRIVIDCLNARHNLSGKRFSNLPNTVITGIRTAQFATQPEEVVRVVLDLKKETIYRIESNNGAVKVFVSDPEAKPFALWSSPVTVPNASNQNEVKTNIARHKAIKVAKTPAKPVVVAKNTNPVKVSKPVTVAKVVNKEEVKDSYKKPIPLQLKGKYGPSKSVTSKPATTLAKAKSKQISKPAKVAAKATTKTEPVKVAQKEKTAVKKQSPVSKSSQTVLAQKETKAKPLAEKPKANAKPRVDVAAKAMRGAMVFSSLKAETNIPALGVIPPGSSTPKKDIHKPTPDKPSNKVVVHQPRASGPAQPKQNKVAKVTPPPVKKSEPVVVASVEKSDAPLKSVRNKTSKYRRDAAKNARMKQSQVVQFPQRLVIKYNTGSMRDPFETLIDVEKSIGGGVITNRVPNIEVLSLVGIINAPNRKGAALMEDHEGIGYILKPGDRVRNGYVAQVDKKAVYFHINEYGWTRTVSKYLQEDK